MKYNYLIKVEVELIVKRRKWGDITNGVLKEPTGYLSTGGPVLSVGKRCAIR